MYEIIYRKIIGIIVFVCLISMSLFAVEANAIEPIALSVFIVDDQTGEELAVKHGIHALNTSDLDVVLTAVLSHGKPVRLLHQAVDEDATDNPTATLDFLPYIGEPPPQAPSSSLPIGQLTKAMVKWRQERKAWQQEIIYYRREMIGQVEKFVRQVVTTQMEVANRFDRMLAANNGRDFNRSDIFGCITAANRELAGQNRKVIILNTDAVDLPAKRAPRISRLTAAELDPSIELIFVNTSHLPEKRPMFTGIKNDVYHADSIKEAMETVVSMLESAKENGETQTDNCQTQCDSAESRLTK